MERNIRSYFHRKKGTSFDKFELEYLEHIKDIIWMEGLIKRLIFCNTTQEIRICHLQAQGDGKDQ